MIKPSKESIKKAKEKMRETVQELYGQNVGRLIKILNPILLGYANYWKPTVSKLTFKRMDGYIWSLVVKFLKLKQVYFEPEKTGKSQDKYILTDPLSSNQLIRMSWTPIQRHVMVKYKNSPFDKELEEYYRKRDIK